MEKKLRIALVLALLGQLLGFRLLAVMAYGGNSAVELDGNGDYLVCGGCGDAAFNAAGLTVEAWIKWDGQWNGA